MDGLSVSEPTGGLAVPAAADSLAVPAAVQQTPAVQDLRARMQAYADAQRAKGLLVEEIPIYGPDGGDKYQALADAGTPVENLFRVGYQFNTNKGNPAKVKGNQSGIVWMDPYAGGNQQFRLVNQKGKDRVAYEGTGLDALTQIHDLAVGLSDKGGKKAHWKVEAYNPQTQGWAQQADDDPAKSNILGLIADIGLPVLGTLLALPTGGLSLGATLAGSLGSAAAAGALGAAGGSALSGIVQGKSIGKILGNAALSGGLSFAGGSLLDGVGGSLGRGASSVAQGAASSTGGALASEAAKQAAAQGFNGITVLGSRGLSALGSLGAGIGAGASGLVNGVSQMASGSGAGNHGGVDPVTGDIVVNAPPAGTNWWENTLPIVGAGGAVVGAGSALGGAAGAGNELAKEGSQNSGGVDDATSKAVKAAQNNGMSASDIANYLKLGSLGVGLLGGLFEKPGGGSAGTMPGGLGSLAPVFSKALPAPTMGNRQPRQMPAQDWTKAAMRPEQSFFTDIPQTYVPPLPGVRDQMWDKYAEGGDVDLAVRGAGDGRSDSVPALVSDGEYVVDAETVALLGNGSSKAGARVLDDMRVNIRKHKGKALAAGKFSNAAKRPEQYLRGGE